MAIVFVMHSVRISIRVCVSKYVQAQPTPSSQPNVVASSCTPSHSHLAPDSYVDKARVCERAIVSYPLERARAEE